MIKTNRQLTNEYEEFLEASGLEKVSADDLRLMVLEEIGEIEILPMNLRSITQGLRLDHLLAYNSYLNKFCEEWDLMQTFERARYQFDNEPSQKSFELLRNMIEEHCPGFMHMYAEVNTGDLYDFACDNK